MAEPRKATTRDVVDMFLGGIQDFWRGLSNAPNPYANQTVLGIPVFKGHTITGKSLDEAVRDLKSTGDVPPSREPSGLDLARPKPLAMTPEGQFDRYFETPEFDYVFGAGSRGKGAPKTVEAALELASGKGVPEGTGIATKYRAESAMGRANMDEIVEAMGYKGSPLEQWARANPMLAFREYNKKFPAGQPTIGPTPAALQASEGPMTAFGQEVKTFFPGAEPGADMDTARLEGEEIIDAVNFLKKKAGLQK